MVLLSLYLGVIGDGVLLGSARLLSNQRQLRDCHDGKCRTGSDSLREWPDGVSISIDPELGRELLQSAKKAKSSRQRCVYMYGKWFPENCDKRVRKKKKVPKDPNAPSPNAGSLLPAPEPSSSNTTSPPSFNPAGCTFLYGRYIGSDCKPKQRREEVARSAGPRPAQRSPSPSPGLAQPENPPCLFIHGYWIGPGCAR